ncbi:unnamed protein product [Lathyrus sativus]|nr:unnamed protein product [Lathyrus sativus]
MEKPQDDHVLLVTKQKQDGLSDSGKRISDTEHDGDDDHHQVQVDGLMSDEEEEGQETTYGNSEVIRQLFEKLAQEQLHSEIGDADAGVDDDGGVSELDNHTDNNGGKKVHDASALTTLLTGEILTIDVEQNNVDNNRLSEEEKMKLEKLQQIRIKFLRLVLRLGVTAHESIAAQVLSRLALIAGSEKTSEIFSLAAAKETAFKLEAVGESLNFSLNILVLGKSGVGKSATINSIFGKVKTKTNAYGSATTAVKEIVGTVDGVSIRVFDTPGLKSSGMEQCYNKKVLSRILRLTKRKRIDMVLYVDRLDTQTKSLNDLPLLKSICDAFGPLIWRDTVITLTHAATAPPEGPLCAPLSYNVFVTQRSRAIQQAVGQAIRDERIMNPSVMNPVALVENHPSCRRNRDGHKVLPNGQTWRPLLLLLCYSMKILSEAASLSKTQELFDYKKVFGHRFRTPSLPYLLSWLMQQRIHPKLASDQDGIDTGNSEIEFAELSDSDRDEDEYDNLLPFRPLTKSQVAKLSREQKRAYFEEYDYRVKLLQKKQWKEELRRMREIKMNKGKTDLINEGYMEESGYPENESPDVVSTPLPDMTVPLSFDGDNPAFRYRSLEPTSQFLTRPMLDMNSWDHDYGYDGLTIENSLALANKFPASFGVQVSKDKEDFSIQLDSSIAAKHGENGSSMGGFDIQSIGKQLAYILRGETKFKNFKRNETCAGVSATFFGENVSTGLKVEDQIALGRCFLLMGSTGVMRCQGNSAYGTNVEVRYRDADFPIGQDQSSLGLSLVKWRGELALGANLQSQFSIRRSYKMAVRAGLNNKSIGQISVKTSSSEQLQFALVAVLPIVRAIYAKLWPKACENHSIF